MHNSSRQQSPIEAPTSHSTPSRGKCSAHGAAAKKNENWTIITDRAERRRVQNRIAQRAYRQKLKERMQLLERRLTQLSSLASTSKPCQNTFNNEACHPHIASNASTSPDEHCVHSHVTSRNTTASPPTSYSSHSTSLTHSPNMHGQHQDMMPYYQDMQQQYPIYHTSEMSQAFTTDDLQDFDLNFPYLQ